MADYREISQGYARSAINACIAINAGSAVALLSQTSELIDRRLAWSVAIAMILWAIGVVVATSIWIIAFISTRYVDKSERELSLSEEHIKTSDLWMGAGLALAVVSLLLFVGGCIALVCGLHTRVY